MSSYLSERHSRSMNTLSILRPRPSIEILTPVAATVPVKAALVNWLPWSIGSGVRSASALLLPEPYVHLSAHTALCSSLAHGHSNIMIVRGDSAAGFLSEDVWIFLRIAPPEVRLRA